MAVGEGLGKPIGECRMVRVVLMVFEPKADLPLLHQQGQAARHMSLVQWLTEEAREQGSLLNQVDLALPLHSDTRTIRRDVWELREQRGI